MLSSKVAISQTLERISHHLILNTEYIVDNSLFYGKSGIALFFYYYARFSDKECYNNYANELFELICDTTEISGNYDYNSGICGIAGFMDHLVKNNFIITDEENICETIDQQIFCSCQCGVNSPTTNFPFAILTYLVNKNLSRNKIQKLDFAVVEKILQGFLDQLSKYAQQSPDELWQHSLALLQKNRNFNLPFMEVGTIPMLLLLQVFSSSSALLNQTIIVCKTQRDQLLKRLDDYADADVGNQKTDREFFWLEYFRITANYSQLTEHYICGGNAIEERLLRQKIYKGFYRILSSKISCEAFYGCIFQGDSYLIMIAKSMARLTGNSFYTRCMTSLLLKYLKEKTGLLAGIPITLPGSPYLTLNKGLAGTGLLLLSCASPEYQPWESLIGLYDINHLLGDSRPHFNPSSSSN